jgi:hypothetical protein
MGDKEKNPKSEGDQTPSPPVDNRPVPRSPLTEMRDIQGGRDKGRGPDHEKGKQRKDSDE